MPALKPGLGIETQETVRQRDRYRINDSDKYEVREMIESDIKAKSDNYEVWERYGIKNRDENNMQGITETDTN